MNDQIDRQGFSLVPGVLEAAECAWLTSVLGPVGGAGRRGLLSHPAVAEIATSERLLNLVRPYTGCDPFPVRVIYFDKSLDGNWLVTWHQDLTIALKERIETPDFGPWSVKDGIPHVQPAPMFLNEMLTVRLHLDQADESTGALRVLPGSHGEGRLSNSSIQEWRSRAMEVICSAAVGDALLMRPLILHASGRSTSSRHRRILHIEYAAFSLPAGLCWHEAA